MKEYYYEKLLNIKTSGNQKNFNKSFHYHPYEPTSYHALEALFNEYEITSSDRLIDFGCGKGRLNFYIYYFYQASAVGIEMNEVFYLEALENRSRYFKKNKKGPGTLEFQCCLAEEYEVTPQDNRFYFFNPFSVQIFMNVLNNIMKSVEKHWREVELILYYSSDEYIYHLETNTYFELKQEVKIPHYYEKNSYERFLIYHIPNSTSDRHLAGFVDGDL